MEQIPTKDSGFSADFKEEVKRAFPDNKELHEDLDAGNEFAISTLENLCSFSMTPQDVLEALESGDQDKVIKAAKNAINAKKIYGDWMAKHQSGL